MAVATARPPVEHAERLFTAADLAEFPSDLPSGTVRYELDNGRLISMSPPGDEHGAVQSNIVTALKNEGERRDLGKARSEVGIVLWRSPDRVVGADAAFIARASLPVRRTREGYLETIPELVVEVVSKNDTRPYIQRKVDDYLAAGVQVVWVADPASRTITAHRRETSPRVFAEDETLTVEDVIPGFQLPVRDAFQE